MQSPSYLKKSNLLSYKITAMNTLYEISVVDEKTASGNDLLKYESYIAPVPGDVYAGINFGDGKQRTVTNRLLSVAPCMKQRIIFQTKITFPNI
jgi:hypothetical protein